MTFMQTPGQSSDRPGPMPGDNIVPDAAVVMDRERILRSPAKDVWPWIVQLGKDRAGRYMPRSVDWVFIPRHRRSLRRIDDHWQALSPGQHIPDWGARRPDVRSRLDRPAACLGVSIDPATQAARRCGTDGLRSVVGAHPRRSSHGRSRLRIRLRTNQIGQRFPRAAELMADAIDRFTGALLFAGLRERVR